MVLHTICLGDILLGRIDNLISIRINDDFLTYGCCEILHDHDDLLLNFTSFLLNVIIVEDEKTIENFCSRAGYSTSVGANIFKYYESQLDNINKFFNNKVFELYSEINNK